MQVLKQLPSCVWTLIEHMGGARKEGEQHATCSNPAYTSLFYHLGYIHSDKHLLPYGAQDIIVQLLATLKVAGGAKSVEISVEWDGDLHVHAPSLRRILLSARSDVQATKGYQLFDGSGSRERSGSKKRLGTGYTVCVKTLRALAPLLQHLLRLSFWHKDHITCHQASARLCTALGVEVGEIWLDTLADGSVLNGQRVTISEVRRLVAEIRELMSGPCRGTLEGVQAGKKYVDNQHRLSSSNVYHRVYRDVPQFAGRDERDGMCVGGEKWDKCMTEAEQILYLQEQGYALSVSSPAYV